MQSTSGNPGFARARQVKLNSKSWRPTPQHPSTFLNIELITAILPRMQHFFFSILVEVGVQFQGLLPGFSASWQVCLIIHLETEKNDHKVGFWTHCEADPGKHSILTPQSPTAMRTGHREGSTVVALWVPGYQSTQAHYPYFPT